MEYSRLEPGPEGIDAGVDAELRYALGSLYDRFQGLSDPRKAKGKRYSLVMLLVVIFLAKLSGRDKPGEIADWAKNHADALVRLLHLRRAWMPHHNTIRRVFQALVSETEFEQLLEAYHQQPGAGIGELLALDGKALKGTRRADQERCEYVVSVYDGQTQRVLVQEVVETKENEIVAAPQALARVPLAGRTVTGDAIHAQRGLSAYIVAQGGHYLWPVKANQPQVYQDIERLFAPQQPIPGFGRIATDFQTAQTTNCGHGRLEVRTIQTSEMLNDYLDWPSVGQVYRLERKFSWVRHGRVYKTSGEVEWGVTSLSRCVASPERLLAIRRRHWLIETGLHYRRDVTFHEDATRMTLGPAGHILSIIHDLVLGLLKTASFTNAAQGRRWFDGHLPQAFALLLGQPALS
jgi:predicted transposase YbfD/YdcC